MAKKRTKPKLPALERTIGKTAKRIGVHERTLREWLASGAPGKPGAYNVDAIKAWRAANRAPAKGNAETSERAKAETRKAIAEAEMKELAAARMRGELVRVDEAARLIGQHIAEVKSHLLDLPERFLAAVKLPATDRKAARERLSAQVREYLKTFEASLRRLAAAGRREGERARKE